MNSEIDFQESPLFEFNDYVSRVAGCIFLLLGIITLCVQLNLTGNVVGFEPGFSYGFLTGGGFLLVSIILLFINQKNKKAYYRLIGKI